jgi:hypothetical protein
MSKVWEATILFNCAMCAFQRLPQNNQKRDEVDWIFKRQQSSYRDYFMFHRTGSHVLIAVTSAQHRKPVHFCTLSVSALDLGTWQGTMVDAALMRALGLGVSMLF